MLAKRGQHLLLEDLIVFRKSLHKSGVDLLVDLCKHAHVLFLHVREPLEVGAKKEISIVETVGDIESLR
jgi:hypothetical protein